MLCSGRSQGTRSITSRAHASISCPQLDTSFHRKPPSVCHRQKALRPNVPFSEASAGFAPCPPKPHRETGCWCCRGRAELPPSPSQPGKEESIGGPRAETACLDSGCATRLGTAGIFSLWPRKGPSPPRRPAGLHRCFGCVAGPRALQDTRAKRRARPRGTATGASLKPRNETEAWHFLTPWVGGWMGGT